MNVNCVCTYICIQIKRLNGILLFHCINNVSQKGREIKFVSLSWFLSSLQKTKK